jgi:hypothetical protein
VEPVSPSEFLDRDGGSFDSGLRTEPKARFTKTVVFFEDRESLRLVFGFYLVILFRFFTPTVVTFEHAQNSKPHSGANYKARSPGVSPESLPSTGTLFHARDGTFWQRVATPFRRLR